MRSSLPGAWIRAGACSAVWLTLVDAAALLLGGGAPGMPWLLVGTLTLGIAAAAVPTLLGVPLLAWPTLARRFPRSEARPAARLAAAVPLLVAATALQLANQRLYLRLYPGLHIAATLGALGVGQVAILVAWPPAAAPGAPRPRLAFALVAAAIVAWAAGLGASLAKILASPVLRVAALDRTTVLGQGLLVLHQEWGLLAPPGTVIDDPTRAELARLTTPWPRTSPGGALRGASILLVTVDSLRDDRVPETGTIARLAAEGVRFGRAYAPSCWTVHSMSAILTSRLPSQLRYTFVSVAPDLSMTPHATNDPLVANPAHFRKVTPVPWDDPTPTLAGLLGRAGYQTATVAAYVFYRREAGVTREFEVVDDRPFREHNLGNDGVTSAPLTDAALEALARRDRARPFFLWVHYMDPHAPYLAHDAAGEEGDALARYDSEVRLVDRELGRLLDAMGRDGALDDTIVVVHSDHGEEFRDHGGQFHATTVYDEIVHVPLIVRLPRRAGAAPRTVTTPVSLLDVAPTLAELVGVGAPDGFVGRSLAGPLAGQPQEARPIFAECTRFGRDKRAVIDWPYKLITDRSVGTLELYDLERDPGERRNLVESRAPADAAARARLYPLASGLP